MVIKKLIAVLFVGAVAIGLAGALAVLGNWAVGLTSLPPYGGWSFALQLPFKFAGIGCFAFGMFLVGEIIKDPNF